MKESDRTETETPADEIKAPIQTEDVKFTKRALISSPKSSIIGRDILKLALDDDREYTIAEVQKAIDKSKGRF